MTDLQISDLFTENLEGKTKPQQTEVLVKYILQSKNVISTSDVVDTFKCMSTQEILDEYHLMKSSNPNIVDIPDGSIATNLSILAKDITSPISCLGKKQGYYLRNNVNQTNSNIANLINDKSNLLEKYLYQFFVYWLLGIGYEKAKDISKKKIMGKWGNPDIVGLRMDGILNDSHYEIVTIEVKLSPNNWKQDIFQAVAHTAFANRSYYAFLNADEEKTFDFREMVEYAQKFNIGILSISLPDNIEVEYLQNSKMDLITISEIVPAPEQTPIRKIQYKFLCNLGIRTQSDYINFQ